MNGDKFKYFFLKDEKTNVINTYTYIEYKDFDTSYLPKRERKFYKEGKYQRSRYVRVGCGFDIETTRIPNSDYTVMFVWQFSVNDITIIGRTWDEFRSLLNDLSTFYELDEKNKLLVYIHNFKYEWSFIKNQLKWNERTLKDGSTKLDVFALDYREVVKATTDNFIEFRDSYVLTQMGLGKLAENYKLGIRKLSGDFDYTLQRHLNTPLTEQELAYCINDVQILSRFVNKYIFREFVDKRIKIPLTSTGIVRDELKRHFKALEKKERERFKKRLAQCYPKYEEYIDLMNWVYRGGFVHANINRANTKFEGDIMGSYDFKSSYPAVMLHEKFPWHFRKEYPEWFYVYGFDKKVLKDIAYWGEFKIHDIKRKTSHTIESKDKIVEYSEDAIFDNGRLMSASWIVVYLTEQDVLNYLDMYTVDNLAQWDCYEIHISEKEELPKYLKDLVLKYFYLKETLQKDTIEYNLAKAKLNAFYGMCCTKINFKDLAYDPEIANMYLTGNDVDFDESSMKQILLPQWGIWISAYARRNLVKTFAKLGNDAIYGDTDSAKIINLLSNEYIFKDYNNVIARMNKTMYVGNYDREIFKDLGKFDFEGKILRFKTLGCKRYIFDQCKYNKKENKYELDTVVKAAGIVKGTFQKYCEKHNLDKYEEFKFGLVIDPEESEKLTSHYEDKPFEVEVTDYYGNTELIKENSCVTLKPEAISITFGAQAKAYLLLMAEVAMCYERTGLINTYFR